MNKNELRARMRALARGRTDSERRAASRTIFGRIARLDDFTRARCVALYCALPDEPDTREALEAWSRTRRVVVPRVEGDVMNFCDYDPATLVTGAFGIAEPGPHARSCPPEEIDLVIVPGMAFTREGVRLGRGRGYYDRYLASPPLHARTIGVCFAASLVEAIPAEPHDIRMDRVISDEM